MEKEYKRGKSKGQVAIGYQSIIISSLSTKVYLDNRGVSGFALTSGSKRKSFVENALSRSFSGFNLVTISVGVIAFKLNKDIGEFKSDPESFFWCTPVVNRAS